MKIKTSQVNLTSLLGMSRKMTRLDDFDAVLMHFLFDAKDGELTVYTTNVELSLLVRTKSVEILEEGRALIPIKTISDALKTVESSDSVEIVSTKDRIEVYTKDTEWSLSMFSDIDKYPSIPSLDNIDYVDISVDELRNGLPIVLSAVSVDGKTLERSLIRLSETCMESSDGVRFQRVMLPGPKEDIILTQTMAINLLEIISAEVGASIKIGHVKDSLVFCIGGSIFIGQQPNEDFSDCSAFMSAVDGNKEILNINRKDFLVALDKARVTSDHETKLIKLTFQKDSLMIGCENRHGDKSNVIVDSFWEGESVELGFNVNFLQSMIKTFNGADVNIKVGKNRGKKLCPISIEEDNHIAILAQAIV